jgi:hypothetical protein
MVFSRRYEAALARWPYPLEDEEEIRFQADLPAPVPELADWIGGIRTDAEGRRGRVLIEASDLVKNGHYRGEKLIRHWVAHLALHLAGGPLTTLVLSKTGDVELKPLPVEHAKAHLTALLAAWQDGMCRPLPLAAKTALEWLKAGDASKARTTYEGGFNQAGEVETDPISRAPIRTSTHSARAVNSPSWPRACSARSIPRCMPTTRRSRTGPPHRKRAEPPHESRKWPNNSDLDVRSGGYRAGLSSG